MFLPFGCVDLSTQSGKYANKAAQLASSQGHGQLWWAPTTSLHHGTWHTVVELGWEQQHTGAAGRWQPCP